MTPTVRPTAIPVLLYHSVRDEPVKGVERWTVSTSQFGEHVSAIVDSGRTPLTVSELVDATRGGRPMPERAVVVTFDDGYLDTLAAVDRLVDRGLCATVYVTAGYLGRRDMLRRSDVASLESRAGVEVGAHGITHRRLDELPYDEIEQELSGSRAVVADLIRHECRSFAYPHGAHDRRVAALTRSTGYSSAAAVKNALSHAGDDAFALARVTIEAGCSLAFLSRALNGDLRLARPGEAWRTRGYRWSRRLARRVSREVPKS
ncbi:MAG: polysaccharide deacetylase family protein [Actinobacteria bacterium]|nr:polysaccharide deacetylase family protein [Actinomycetota bacterium]